MLNLRRPSGGRYLRSTWKPILVAVGVAALLTVSSVAFAVWTAGGSGKAAARTAHWTGTEDPHGPVTPPTNSGSRPTDTIAPSTIDDTAVIGGGWSRTERTVTLRPRDRGGSGVAATYFTTDDSTPTTASREGTAVRVGEGVHVIRYFSVDRAGNREHVQTATTPIRVDQTAPSVATLGPLPEAIREGQVLSSGGDDALSGVAQVDYEFCAGADCATWTPIGSSRAAPGFVLVWRQQPPDGSYQVRASVLDAAGNPTASVPRTVRVENSRPTATVRGRDDRAVEVGDTLTVEMSKPIDRSSLPAAGSLTFSRSSGGRTSMEIPSLTDGPVDTGTTAWVADGATVTYSGTLALSNRGLRVRFTAKACRSGCDDAVAGDAGVQRSAPAASPRDR
jgi:hypothetical protein